MSWGFGGSGQRYSFLRARKKGLSGKSSRPFGISISHKGFSAGLGLAAIATSPANTAATKYSGNRNECNRVISQGIRFYNSFKILAIANIGFFEYSQLLFFNYCDPMSRRGQHNAISRGCGRCCKTSQIVSSRLRHVGVIHWLPIKHHEGMSLQFNPIHRSATPSLRSRLVDGFISQGRLLRGAAPRSRHSMASFGGGGCSGEQPYVRGKTNHFFSERRRLIWSLKFSVL